MNINEFTQFFENPAVSIFNRSCSKSFPVQIGKFYPAKWELLSFGNSQKSRCAHSMRLAPLVAPTFSNMQFHNHSAIIPIRTIMSDYETKFNYAINRDGAVLPHFSVGDYHNVLSALLKCGVNPVGSLLDFLGYPVYADVYKAIDWNFFYMGNTTDLVETSVFDSYPYAFFADPITDNKFLTFGSVTYRDYDINISSFAPFVIWLACKSILPQSLSFPFSIESVNALRVLYSRIPGAVNSDASISTTYVPSLDELIKASIFETSKEAIDQYKLYLFDLILQGFLNEIHPSEQNYTTLPLRAYWRFMYDWNTNGNFTDRDILLEENVYNFETAVFELVNIINTGGAGPVHFDALAKKFTVWDRLWNDDFFTSMLPTSTVDNAVEIPANSTVLDLAKLTAWQKFVMRLSYSSRYRDVVWNLFKIKPSDARLQQSYPIFRSYENIGIGEVNQTSSSDVSGVLGGFAGRGYSAGRNKGYSIFCEEPCIVIDFVSIMPKAVYADALHPLIHVDDILDFPLPDMDVLGNQPIYADFVSGNPDDADVVLGYGRQYQEWLNNYSTVHGEFKTTLDYWMITRRFSDTPVINDDFLRIHPADDLDNIFSLQGSDHAFLDIYFDAKVTRHVHRNVRIKI